MRTLLAVSAVLFYAVLGAAQAPDPALQKTIETRNAALWSGNASDWGRYTTDDFLSVGADGAVKSKTQRMHEINGVKIKSPAQPQEEQFRRYGATVIRTWRVNPQNGPAMRFTEVWVEQSGTWKVASVHMCFIKS